MNEPVFWEWKVPSRQTKLITVEDHILWSYSVLSITRIAMDHAKADKPNPYPDGRSKAANRMMSLYRDGRKSISSAERDDALAQKAAVVCAHCGQQAVDYHADHLIPRSKLGYGAVPWNQVISCARCDTSRGNKDLMIWYRQRMTFPSLAVLRRYLKVCHLYAEQRGHLKEVADEAVKNGLPFDPTRFPRKFPPVELLVWDYAYSGH